MRREWGLLEMVRSKLFYSTVLMLFVLLSSCASAGEPVDKTLEREILEMFAEYQDEAVSGSKHLAHYFSKDINEIWLNWLLEKESTERLLVTHRAIKNRVSFGARIRDVYEYKVTRVENGVVVLSLIYKMTPDKFATYEISYTKQSGRWLINHRMSDTTRPKNYSGHLIEDFPWSVLKDN